jgi:hypothetical protein
MTDLKWLRCRDAKKMLMTLRGSVSERKARLCMCACCRATRREPGGNATDRTIEVGEKWADEGRVDQAEIIDTILAAEQPIQQAIDAQDYRTASRLMETHSCVYDDPFALVTYSLPVEGATPIRSCTSLHGNGLGLWKMANLEPPSELR